MRSYVQQISYDEMREYGKLFREIRNKLGFNLTEMAEEVGVFRTTISKWEKGTTIPQTDIRYITQRYNNILKKYNKE